jgi:serine/threonine protein phosphatase PrpC
VGGVVQQISRHQLFRRDPFQAYTDSCRLVSDWLNSGQCGFDCQYSGTTACFGVLQGGKSLLLGNVGDSRALVARLQPNGSVQGVDLTHDDKPTDDAEQRRIGEISPLPV